LALSREAGLAAWLETEETDGMKPSPERHYRHRFPAEIISPAVWLYHVFSLSLRDVELLLAERGVVVSYETVRRWCGKFGQPLPTTFVSADHGPGTRGTSMRCSFASRERSTIFGALWIRTALCSTSLFRRDGMPKQRSVSSGGYWKVFNMCRV
jgi:hypothetical protein